MARRFVDARGTEWEVWEVGARLTMADAPPPRPRRGPADTPCLRFESATQRRRLAPYPARWEALTTDELAALCQAATLVAPAVAVKPIVLELPDAM